MIARRQFLLGCAGASVVLPSVTNSKFQFPRPKFHLGQEVVLPWQGDEGMRYGRAIIIGAIHNPAMYEPQGWWYLPLWTDNPECPWMIGRDDGNFWHEHWLKAV
jgi:hypothetical protein